MLRDIPALAEMDGGPERIYAYYDEYPRHVSLAQAIHQMPAPATARELLPNTVVP